MATNKRIRNKQKKQAQTEYLKQKGLSEKELKNMSRSTRKKKETAYNAAETRKANREARVQAFRDVGVPDSVIQTEKLYLKEAEKKLPYYKAKYTREANKNRRIQAMLDKGFTMEEIKAHKLHQAKYEKMGKDEIDSIINPAPFNSHTRVTANQYLYVGFAEVINGLYIPNLSFVPDYRLIEMINDRLDECRAMPDDSDGLQGIFVIDRGSKSNMEHKAKAFYKRGYNLTSDHVKMDVKQYSKITVSNSWTKREILELLYTVVTQTGHAQALDCAAEIKGYCRNNGLPFLDDVDI